MSGGEIGRGSNRVAKALLRFVVSAQVEQQAAEVVVRQRVLWVQGQRGAEM